MQSGDTQPSDTDSGASTPVPPACAGGTGESSADGGAPAAAGNNATLVHIGATPTRLSPTGVAMFRQCPQRWKFRYVDRLADPPGEAALAGTLAHRVLEGLMGLEPADRTQDRARQLATEFWTEMQNDEDFVALGLDSDGIRNFKWTAWQAIEGLWVLEDPTEVEVVATETEVAVSIGGVPFIGYIDRLERAADGLVISDYKSGRAPARKFADARLEQVLLYAAALAELEGALPARARLIYLGQRIDPVEVTADRISGVTERLSESWEDLRRRATTGDFPPRPGPLCGWCAFVRHCPDGLAEVERRHLAGTIRPDAPSLAEAV